MTTADIPLQSIVFPDSTDEDRNLYFRATLPLSINETDILIPKGCIFTTDTYMNLFDRNFWEKYTGIQKVLFYAELSGHFKISLINRTFSSERYNDSVCFCQEVFDYQSSPDEPGQFNTIEIPVEKPSGYCFLRIEAISDVRFRDAAFAVSHEMLPQINRINIAVNICTYKREKQVLENIERLKRTLFFQEGNIFSGQMDIFLIDNASTLKYPSEKRVHYFPNKNTGGSGGFTRGLEEISRSSGSFSHVLFMDDDVEFIPESFYRLFALLSCLKPEYLDSVIAGRMFRLDRKNIQYTACEVWNSGNIRHIGLNTDMSLPENLGCLNDSAQAEYGGWWFCCFPWSFAGENRPLPVFLHCDDVEYGLRHGSSPLILNGIQVWHETFEYRQSPVVLYYDTRNPLFVNSMRGCLNLNSYYQTWKKDISVYHAQGDYEREYMVIRGFYDFLKGERWLYHHDSEKLHKKLSGRKKHLRYRNALFWRLTVMRLKKQLR